MIGIKFMTLPEYLSANARDSDIRELTFSALFAADEAKGPFSVSDNYNFTFRFSPLFDLSSPFSPFLLKLFKLLLSIPECARDFASSLF